MAIGISVNGEKREIPEAMSVMDLLAHLEIEPGRVAVELNREIARKQEWATTPVEDGAELEIVHFVGGG
ncbi:MAG: sulfur carrier protein ThiS [Bryobacteraceae bacterium]